MSHVVATIAFIFTDDNGSPLHPVLDGRCLASPIVVVGEDAAEVEGKIENELEALRLDMKQYVVANEDYMLNEGCYGFQGIVHEDTMLDSISGATAQEIHFA